MSLSEWIHDALINSPFIVFLRFLQDYPHNHNKHAHSFCHDFDWGSASRF